MRVPKTKLLKKGFSARISYNYTCSSIHPLIDGEILGDDLESAEIDVRIRLVQMRIDLGSELLDATSLSPLLPSSTHIRRPTAVKHGV